MFDGLRVISQNWLGRGIMALVLGFMVVSFAIWGIGDVFRGFTSQRLVKVGGGEISVETYRSAYQNELRRLQQRLRRAVTNDEARRAGLDQQVLERLITDATLDARAKGLGLATSDEEVQRQLKTEKVFQGPNGQFDPERFKQIVNDAGYSERSFLVEQKAVVLRKAITDSITSGLEAPRLMLEAIHRFRNETRSIDAFLLPASAIGATIEPSDEEIKKYYHQWETAFRAREYRRLTILADTAAAIAKTEDVPEADVRKLYDEVKGQRYGTAEKREVSQIVFKTEAEAKEALEKLKGGLSFEALAKERNLTPKDVDLGLVAQSDFGDAKVAASVFAPPAPGYAEIAATPFGYAVSQIRKIQPAVLIKTFEQATPELRLEIAAKKTAPEVRRLHDAIEEQRGAGKSLAETAQATGLKTRDIDWVDDLGRDKAGKPVVADIPGGQELLKAAFASDKGVDNEAVATRDGGYVWFDVTDIEQSRQKNYDEVKGEVVAAMKRDAEQKALTTKANELVEQIRGGKPIDNLSGELGLPLRHIADVRRANRPDYSASTIVQFFEQPVRGAGATPIEGGQLVFQVISAATPPFDPNSAEMQSLKQQLKPAIENDVLEQYVGGLEKAYNVDINQKALQAAVGGDSDR
ncbi:MAG TPA: SurA N-terminal domain-containing protein [Methylocystis sp.]|nr:SurA N-terminal domain-containing protein [Methylocystis sp.]